MEKEIVINGETYILKSELNQLAPKVDNMPYVLVRTYSAGVHVGYMSKQEENNPKHITLIRARRIWYWTGAASLSQLAMEGVKKPQDCKFSMEVESIELTEAIEIISVTESAQQNIGKVAIWKQ